ncbi:MAG TPA: hypothetical protein VHH09_02595 [Acidimicrobiales bacterium]|nr:hypothetical protein [Acidimicrobiales bacterium]
MGEPGRIQMWWGGLSTGWRVNVLLYMLATVSLLALITEIVIGGDEPRRVEVAGQVPRRTPTTQAGATTTVSPTTSVPPTTVAAVAPTTAATSRPAPEPTRPRQRASPPPVAFNPVPQSPDPTLACRNSGDPRCGEFRWDPSPGPNQPLAVRVDVAPEGTQARFTFDVSDPDHTVTDNCAQLDYGDGQSQPFPCNPAPCPPTFGPWTPPPREPGQRQFVFRHTYNQPGEYTAKFTFRNDRDRCPDPYGNSQSDSIVVTVGPGT